MNVIGFSLLCEKGILIALSRITSSNLLLLRRKSETILRIASIEDPEISEFPVVGAYIDSYFLPVSKDLVPNRSTVTSRTANSLVVVIKICFRVISVHFFERRQSNRVDASVVRRNSGFLKKKMAALQRNIMRPKASREKLTINTN